MACRVGMSTNPQERMEYWKRQEGCTSGHVLTSGLTYDEALTKERELAQRGGSRHSSGGDETTAVAAVDRLVHHATILEMNVESYRRRAALENSKRKRGRPANFATEKNTKD